MSTLYNEGFGSLTSVPAATPVTFTALRNNFPPSATYIQSIFFPANTTLETPPCSGGLNTAAIRPFASHICTPIAVAKYTSPIESSPTDRTPLLHPPSPPPIPHTLPPFSSH